MNNDYHKHDEEINEYWIYENQVLVTLLTSFLGKRGVILYVCI